MIATTKNDYFHFLKGFFLIRNFKRLSFHDESSMYSRAPGYERVSIGILQSVGMSDQMEKAARNSILAHYSMDKRLGGDMSLSISQVISMPLQSSLGSST